MRHPIVEECSADISRPSCQVRVNVSNARSLRPWALFLTVVDHAAQTAPPSSVSHRFINFKPVLP